VTRSNTYLNQEQIREGQRPETISPEVKHIVTSRLYQASRLECSEEQGEVRQEARLEHLLSPVITRQEGVGFATTSPPVARIKLMTYSRLSQVMVRRT
jgi:hypothetical protein